MKKKDIDKINECCINKKGLEPGCSNYNRRLDLIHKVIDGQATEEEKQMYEEVISNCINCQCRQYCEQELAIKNLLITKLDRKRVPLDVIESIKTNIIKTT